MRNKTVLLASASISAILHPFLMPIIVTAFIFCSGTVFSMIPLSSQLWCYLIIALSTIIVPILFLPLLKRLKLINSYELLDHKERIAPIIVSIVCAFIGFFFIRTIPYTKIISGVILCMNIILLTFSSISLFWKISMHMTGVGALCAFVAILWIKYGGDLQYMFAVAILLSGLMGSARLFLGCHTVLQVLAGFVLGFTIPMVLLF